MKNIFLLLFIIFICNPIYSQFDNIDSTLNAFERRYRNELNKSDTIFIDNIMRRISETDCGSLNNYFLSHEISGTIKKEIVKKAIDHDFCFDLICNYINLYDYDVYSESVMSSTHYPIYNFLINNPKYLKKTVDYLINSDYLNDCSYLIKYNKKHLEAIYYLLSKTNTVENYISEYGDKIDNCKLANLILLANSFKDGYIEEIDYNKYMIFPKIPDQK